MDFTVKLTANTALPCSSLVVTNDGLRYLGHAHQLYQRQVRYKATDKQ